LISCGLKLPARSRGTSRLTGPASVSTRLGSGAVAWVAAVAAARVVLGVAKMIIQLALERRVHDPFGQPGQQPALTGQLQPLRSGPIGELLDQLLIHRVELIRHCQRRLRPLLLHHHFSHNCLLRLRSYTVKVAVPVPRGNLREAASGLGGGVMTVGFR